MFIEGSRSKYLEDLHSEAQEGLKILQQEGEHLLKITIYYLIKIVNLLCASHISGAASADVHVSPIFNTGHNIAKNHEENQPVVSFLFLQTFIELM